MSEPRPVRVGVDVGGTKILAGVVDADGVVQDVAVRRTPGRTSSVLLLESTVAEAVEEVVDGRPVAAVGLAAAGFVDGAGERVMFAPHLPWRDEGVRARLAERWSAPVVLDNDASGAQTEKPVPGTPSWCFTCAPSQCQSCSWRPSPQRWRSSSPMLGPKRYGSSASQFGPSGYAVSTR